MCNRFFFARRFDDKMKRMSALLRNRELDSLRGASILLVLLGHSVLKTYKLHPLLIPFFDAALGVRMFFVLSGFIITSLLLREKETKGTIDWKNFLLKRFSKLIPSLILLIVIVQVLNRTKAFGCSVRDYLTSLFFVSELFGIQCWPLAHTWSLSVEELFYLTWLPCMIFLTRKSVLRVLGGVVVIAPFVRSYNHLLNSHAEWFQQGLYFSIPWISHLDLIAWGSLGAFYKQSSRLKSYWGISVLLIFGLFATAIPFGEISFLKWLDYLAIPFRSTVQGMTIAFLICFLVSKKQSRRSLRLINSLGYLGTISYSLYLVQQVVIPNPYLTTTQNEWTAARSVFYFLLALGVGVLSFHLIEKPCMAFLRRKCKIPSSELIFSSGTNHR